jgi:hypothetical protein
MNNLLLIFSLVVLLAISCNNASNQDNHKTTDQKTATGSNQVSPLDTLKIQQVIGKSGSYKDGEYKITIPQNDLNVVVDGFKIIPPMGLGTWIAFTPTAEGAMIMGDIVLTVKDLSPVQQEVIRQGLSITAIHNHFIRNNPNVMYMHIGGSGATEALAQKAKAVLNRVNTLRGKDPSSAAGGSVMNSINIAMLDSIIGHKGEMSNGVYKYTIGRPDVDLKEHGAQVSSFMGFNTWAAWQGSPERAAVSGDFAMLANEVDSVVSALIKNNIQVVALHNHMMHEEPKIFFLHYWAIGAAEAIAQGLRAALDHTGKSRTAH